MIEVIAAHRDGKKIEATHKACSEWEDVINPPLWNFQHNNYRIKPESLTLDQCWSKAVFTESPDGMLVIFLKLAKENGHV